VNEKTHTETEIARAAEELVVKYLREYQLEAALHKAGSTRYDHAGMKAEAWGKALGAAALARRLGAPVAGRIVLENRAVAAGLAAATNGELRPEDALALLTFFGEDRPAVDPLEIDTSLRRKK
jgi:hypothetical protein